MAATSGALAARSVNAEKALFGGAGSWAMDTETTGAATATRTGVTAKQHCCFKVVVGFAVAPTAAVTLQVKDGTTVIFQTQIPAALTAPVPIDFGLRPLWATQGADLVATCTDAGGIVNLWMCGDTQQAP